MNNLKTLDAATKNIISASSKIRKFLEEILDPKSFVETDVFLSGSTFLDGSEALGEGVITGYASIGDEPVYLFAQNQEVLKGSFSKSQGDKIIKVINQAVKNSVPLIAVIDSFGARIGEGIGVLEAYSSVVNAITVASEEIPVITVVKGNCVGLMSSVPSLSDFVFVSEDAVISLSAPTVAAAKGGYSGKLTDVLGSKVQASSGVAGFTFKDSKSLALTLKEVLAIVGGKDFDSEDDPNRTSPSLNKAVDAKSLLSALCDKGNFLEVSSGYAKELKTGFAKINGIYTGIIISDSSVSGYLSKDALIKYNDFIELLDKYNIPLITLTDSLGIEPDLKGEQSGISKDYAKVMKSLSISGMAKIAVIYGKAIGNGYAALASKSIGYDYVLALSDAEISPVSADVAVNLLYTDEIKNAKDPNKAREDLTNKYASLQGNPINAAKEGYIDNVIEPQAIRPYVSSALLMLLGL